MSVETHQMITRAFASGMIVFYLYSIAITLMAIKTFKIKNANWHLLMCFFTAIYSLLSFSSTFYWFPKAGDYLIWGAWIFGFLAYYCYLHAVEQFLDRSPVLLSIARYLVLTIIVAYISSALLYSFTEISLTSMFGWQGPLTIFQKSYHITSPPSAFANLLGGLGVVAILMASSSILLSLQTRQKREVLLTVGVFVTLLVAINDILLALGLISSLLPIYFLGNLVEAIRFTQHYIYSEHHRLMKLESEVLRNQVELNNAKMSRDLLRMLSHDISTGVSLISFSSEFLNNRPLTEKVVQDAQDKIKRGLGIIDDISTLVKNYESAMSKERLILSPVNLRFLFDQISLHFETSLERKNISLITEIGVQAEAVQADSKLLLNHVLANLVSNAIKFSEVGGKILIQTQLKEDQLELLIQDFGAGIHQQDLELLLDKNQSVSRIGTKGEMGTGFGLRIATQFVEKMGGQLKIESSTEPENSGTRVRIYLMPAVFPEQVSQVNSSLRN